MLSGVGAIGTPNAVEGGQVRTNRACDWCQRCLRVLCTADPAAGVIVECAWRLDTSRCVRCRGAHRGTYDCFVVGLPFPHGCVEDVGM